MEKYFQSEYEKQKSYWRTQAIEFQHGFSETPLDDCYKNQEWVNLWQHMFLKYGKRYGLLREFRENGII